MSILGHAWQESRLHRIGGALVAALRPVRKLRAAIARNRAIRDLETLPGSVLRDIGIRRDEIPLVVAAAAAEVDDGSPPPSDSPASARRAGATVPAG